MVVSWWIVALLPSVMIRVYNYISFQHPDMYKRALLHLPGELNQKSYTQKVDLWSLGVTVYHTATGELPFRPYGGRNNKDTM